MKQIGIIKRDGKLMAVSLDALVWASVSSREFFDRFFELTPTNKTVNLKEVEVFGSIDLDKE
jgi:hypothetical protein